MTNKVLAYAAEYDRTEWTALDPALNADIAFLKSSHPRRMESVEPDQGQQPLDAAHRQRDGAREVRALRSQGAHADHTFSARPKLEGAPLASMHARVIKARDGLELVSYLTLPKGSDADGNGVPDKPLPMVLNVHGGPWGRDSFGYNPEHQWLANRGYAVLSVNFRGSTGFGKAFVNAGDKEWAGKMHDDLIDAVDWAVGERIAQQGQGRDLRRLVRRLRDARRSHLHADDLRLRRRHRRPLEPEHAAGEHPALLGLVPRQLSSAASAIRRRRRARSCSTDRSPLFRADKIQRPLLIAQGANDPRVKQAESDQIVNAMTQKKLPVTYVLYPDEGHGFARPENRISFYAISEAFLSPCLGGRFEPIGEDFEGSSVAVPAGAEHIPGLKEALAGR